MKRKYTLLSLLLCFLLVFTACAVDSADSGVQKDAAGEYAQSSLLYEIKLQPGAIEIEGLAAGMSMAEVLAAQGLTEEDVSIQRNSDSIQSLQEKKETEGLTEDEDIILSILNPAIDYVITEEIWIYDESPTYPMRKRYTFNEDQLTKVEYILNLLDVPYEEAYSAAMVLLGEVNRAAEGVESAESGSIGSLKEVGGGYLKQWKNGEQLMHISISYQDMTEADHTDIDLINVGIGVTL